MHLTSRRCEDDLLKKMTIFVNFFEKNVKFLSIILTFNWQFSGELAWEVMCTSHGSGTARGAGGYQWRWVVGGEGGDRQRQNTEGRRKRERELWGGKVVVIYSGLSHLAARRGEAASVHIIKKFVCHQII